MILRAFPVLYATDVERVAAFYRQLGFVEHFRLPGDDGKPGFIGLHREGSELAVTTEASPRTLAGVEPGAGPRHEMFIYVDDVDRCVATLRDDAPGLTLLREPAAMPWGERCAYLKDPEGNMVTLATAVR